MDKDFYENYKGTKCPDKLFSKDIRKIKQVLDYSMDKYERNLTPDELKDRRISAREFQKKGLEKNVSVDQQDLVKDLEAAASPSRPARKRGKNMPSYAEVKTKIDAEDADRKSRGVGEYKPTPQQKAYRKALKKARASGDKTALPQSPRKTVQGIPQKGQTDNEAEFNAQQNLERRIRRQGMADSGATPVGKLDAFPDPKTGPSSKLTFSKFQRDQQKRFAQNKKDTEAADAYKQTPEYALQTKQVDPNTGENLSKDEIKRRFKLTKRGQVSPERKEAEKNIKRDQSKISPDTLDPVGGFTRGRKGTLTRNKSQSPNVETMPGKIGRKFTDMADKTQTAQQSMMGALGGFVTKGVSSSAAGAEAGMRYARGDKTGAALSALQGMGGAVGFTAGVANALRSMQIAKGGKTAGLAKRVPPEKLAMAGAIGGAVIPQIRNALSRVKIPPTRGGRAIQVTAGG